MASSGLTARKGRTNSRSESLIMRVPSAIGYRRFRSVPMLWTNVALGLAATKMQGLGMEWQLGVRRGTHGSNRTHFTQPGQDDSSVVGFACEVKPMELLHQMPFSKCTLTAGYALLAPPAFEGIKCLGQHILHGNHGGVTKGPGHDERFPQMTSYYS